MSCAWAIAVFMTAVAANQTAGALPPALRARLTQDRFQMVASIRGLPLGVRDEMQSMFGGGLDIAEPGAPFRGTGPVSPLPLRRLAVAACSPEYCIVYYERGGHAHTWHVALFHWTPSATRMEWGGSAPAGLRTADDVRAAALSGAVKGPATTW